jgi:hypothetical protein
MQTDATHTSGHAGVHVQHAIVTFDYIAIIK